MAHPLDPILTYPELLGRRELAEEFDRQRRIGLLLKKNREMIARSKRKDRMDNESVRGWIADLIRGYIGEVADGNWSHQVVIDQIAICAPYFDSMCGPGFDGVATIHGYSVIREPHLKLGSHLILTRNAWR